jgi:hypothetical protein
VLAAASVLVERREIHDGELLAGRWRRSPLFCA